MTIARFMCAECGWVYESRLAAVECGQFDKAEGRNLRRTRRAAAAGDRPSDWDRRGVYDSANDWGQP